MLKIKFMYIIQKYYIAFVGSESIAFLFSLRMNKFCFVLISCLVRIYYVICNWTVGIINV